MRELWVWRTLAMGSLAALGVVVGNLPTGAPMARSSPVAERPHATVQGEPQGPVLAPRRAPEVDEPPTEAALDAARREVRAELDERRRAHEQERRDHALDAIAEFVEENHLPNVAAERLEDALLAFQDRMQTLRPHDPTQPPPSDDDREAHHARVEASFERLHDDVAAVLGDGDLAEDFHAVMRPPGPPGFGPPPHP